MPHRTIVRGKQKKHYFWRIHSLSILAKFCTSQVGKVCTICVLSGSSSVIKFGLTLKCNFIFFWSHGRCWGCRLIRAWNLELWLQTFVHWHYFDCCCCSTSHCCSSYNEPCYNKRRLHYLLKLEQYFKQEDLDFVTLLLFDVWATSVVYLRTTWDWICFMNFCSDVSSNNIGGVLPNQLPPSIQNLWAIYSTVCTCYITSTLPDIVSEC